MQNFDGLENGCPKVVKPCTTKIVVETIADKDENGQQIQEYVRNHRNWGNEPNNCRERIFRLENNLGTSMVMCGANLQILLVTGGVCSPYQLVQNTVPMMEAKLSHSELSNAHAVTAFAQRPTAYRKEPIQNRHTNTIRCLIANPYCITQFVNAWIVKEACGCKKLTVIHMIDYGKGHSHTKVSYWPKREAMMGNKGRIVNYGYVKEVSQGSRTMSKNKDHSVYPDYSDTMVGKGVTENFTISNRSCNHPNHVDIKSDNQPHDMPDLRKSDKETCFDHLHIKTKKGHYPVEGLRQVKHHTKRTSELRKGFDSRIGNDFLDIWAMSCLDSITGSENDLGCVAFNRWENVLVKLHRAHKTLLVKVCSALRGGPGRLRTTASILAAIPEVDESREQCVHQPQPSRFHYQLWNPDKT